jgi:dethiobiotin synthetase
MLRLPSPDVSGKRPQDAHGLIVTGTQARCGKTVLCAGLVGVLRELGFRAQAIKPLAFLPPLTIRRSFEQTYFDRLSPPLQPVDTLSAESPHAIEVRDWRRLIELCRKRAHPYILETPGGLSTPIRVTGEETLDAVDLAAALELPLLLAARKEEDILAVLPPVFAYAALRQAPLIGWVAVETEPPPPGAAVTAWPQDLAYLNRYCNVPYLGEIPFSASVSVEALRQGNLFRITETGVDLLPIQQALNVSVPLS